MKISKTNVIRILEAKNVQHSVKVYEVDENDLSGESVAKKINANPDSVFKTLVAQGDKNGINIFCIPVTMELNIKKAASASGNKKIEMVKMKELFELTGYVRGGCSPIGMKKQYPTCIDETVQLFDEIYVSAGVRGMQICLSPPDLQKLLQAKLADLI
jgi:Cys-tRNA(Pro)/Cys-tRNA(Cys) deacylase